MAARLDRVRGITAGPHPDDRALRTALLDEIRRHVTFAAYAWLLTDPETEVGSAPLSDVPSVQELPRLIRAKYLTTTNRWTTLESPVATLVDVTRGQPEHSLMWREVLSAHGIDDVASVVFRDAHGCWGWLDLWRRGGSFSPDAIDYLTAIAPPVTEALRRSQARTFEHAPSPADASGPVVLVLSPLLDVKAQTPDTEAYLRALVPPSDDRRPVPAGAYNVGAQLLAVEAGVDGHHPSARVHVGGGLWVTLRAARVAATGRPEEQDIAVTIERSSPSERRTLFARSHALTPREAEVVELLARGADTRAVADELFLSEHTVQDHLKSVFTKTGARNRRTLLTRVTGR